jgi:hypothetical protein
MKAILPALALVTAATLAACGGEKPPAPAAEAPVAAAEPAAPVAEPVPAPVASPVPATPDPAVPQQQESFATKTATVAMPADAIGGSPVTNSADAWVRGNEAMKKYCADTAIPCDSFYVKESPQETSGYYTMQFYGSPNGEGMYVGVRVYPDGRAEIVR